MVKTPGRARRAVFSAIVLVALIAIVELCSTIALYFVDGKWFTPSRAAVKRERIQRQAEARSNVTQDPEKDPEAPNFVAPGEVVHPFLGFVRDPRGLNDLKVGPLGFYEFPPPPGPESARFTIAVFGGSLANQFVLRRQSFVRELEASPLFRGKKIWVRSFAMGGYKQPQQLLALNYLLALGKRFDLVLNIDGFNDVALAPEAHLGEGLFPFYPREWPNRVTDLPDLPSQRLFGEIAYLEHRRAQRADWCASPPWSISPSCHLFWRWDNRRQAARADALREALLIVPRERGFLAHGPQVSYSSEKKLLRELAELWGRSSLQMHRACERSDIRYFHFLQPNQYVAGSKKLTRIERVRAFDPDHRWGRFVPKGYARLVREGRELTAAGVRFNDLRMLFADVVEPVYIDRCCHINRRGNELLGQAMARVILRDLEKTPMDPG